MVTAEPDSPVHYGRHTPPFVQRVAVTLRLYGIERRDPLNLAPSFRDGPKDQPRNLEIPGSPLRAAPKARALRPAACAPKHDL